MSDLGLRPKMLVKDVMSSPVVTIDENAPANHAAALMNKYELGCVIVTGKDGKPLGIITERDLVRRVLAKNVKPDSLKAADVMTAPLITIEPGKTIGESAKRMNRLKIRRLAVLYKEQMVGVLSSKDVVGVMPELIETIQQQALIESENRVQTAPSVQTTPLTGYCDRCSSWSDALKETNGDFLCEDCAVEME